MDKTIEKILDPFVAVFIAGCYLLMIGLAVAATVIALTVFVKIGWNLL